MNIDIRANMFHCRTGTPMKVEGLAYIRNELIPGPRQIPACDIPTKMAVYFVKAQGLTICTMNFLVISLAPPMPRQILPAIKSVKAIPCLSLYFSTRKYKIFARMQNTRATR